MATTATKTAGPLPAGALLARLGQEATARFRRALRPMGIGAQQFIVLKQLQAMGATSQAALADAVAVDYSNLATVAGELCDRRLIDRSRDESDRRRYVLELTAAGTRLLERAERAIADGEDEMLGALDEDERERFYGLLRRVADRVEICPTETACAQ
jgi:MarR family transcriptional regulator, lower aerobic nicotinate degradation pathway regulator